MSHHLYQLANERTHEAEKVRGIDPGAAEIADWDADRLLTKAEAAEAGGQP